MTEQKTKPLAFTEGALGILLGCPLTLFSAMLFSGIVNMLFAAGAQPSSLILIAYILAPTAGIVLGLLVMLYRRGVVIEKERQVMTRWSGLLWWAIKREEVPIHAAREVRVVERMEEIRERYKSRFVTNYAVVLERGGQPIRVGSSGNVWRMREQAGKLGEYLELPVKDETEKKGVTSA